MTRGDSPLPRTGLGSSSIAAISSRLRREPTSSIRSPCFVVTSSRFVRSWLLPGFIKSLMVTSLRVGITKLRITSRQRGTPQDVEPPRLAEDRLDPSQLPFRLVARYQCAFPLKVLRYFAGIIPLA